MLKRNYGSKFCVETHRVSILGLELVLNSSGHIVSLQVEIVRGNNPPGCSPFQYAAGSHFNRYFYMFLTLCFAE